MTTNTNIQNIPKNRSKACRMLYVLLLLFGMSLQAYSQKLSVAEFYYAESDLTAQGRETSVIDQNGDKCALIRIQTTEKGFVFDVGSAGILKVDDNHVGEVWVYVPYGVRHISIRHSRLGSLLNYNFPISIQKARTYIMELAVSNATITDADTPTSQYLVFKLTPTNATIIVNDEVWETNNGSARKYVPMGKYSYRVIAPNHKAQSGVIMVDDPNEKKIVNVNLKSEIVNVDFKVANDAEIWLNGEKKGVGQHMAQLGNGTYLIEAKKSGHRTTKREIVIDYEKGNQEIELIAPTPVYGSLNISTTPDFATIYIDGEEVGDTPEILHKVLVGHHNIIIEHDGYKAVVDTVYIEEGKVTDFDEEMVKDEDFVYDVVEQMPTFPGGNSKLLQYIATNSSYPESARKLGIEGRVLCTFTVNKNGSISDVKVAHSVNEKLDKEAVRVVKTMPRWIPGTMHGEKVRVKCSVPVIFKLKY